MLLENPFPGGWVSTFPCARNSFSRGVKIKKQVSRAAVWRAQGAKWRYSKRRVSQSVRRRVLDGGCPVITNKSSRMKKRKILYCNGRVVYLPITPYCTVSGFMSNQFDCLPCQNHEMSPTLAESTFSYRFHSRFRLLLLLFLNNSTLPFIINQHVLLFFHVWGGTWTRVSISLTNMQGTSISQILKYQLCRHHV